MQVSGEMIQGAERQHAQHISSARDLCRNATHSSIASRGNNRFWISRHGVFRNCSQIFATHYDDYRLQSDVGKQLCDPRFQIRVCAFASGACPSIQDHN